MKSIEEIYQEMLAVFSRETGMALSGTGEQAVRMYALAAQVYGLYQEAAWVRAQCFPQTAVGEDLDRHAFLRGLSRREAARAEGTLRFSVETAAERNLPIPAGTVCVTAGLTAFETTEAGVLPAGSLWVELPARAVEPGEGGNVAARTIRTMTVAPAGIAAVINPAPFTGGGAGEDDEALRARVLETYQAMPNGANAAYYAQQALTVPGVAAVRVLPKSRGLGTVDVVVASPAGVPAQSLLEQVRALLAEKREIAVDVEVTAPTALPVTVLVQVKAEKGQNAGEVRNAVKEAIRASFDGTRLGQDVLLAKLGQLIYSVPGVENYTIVSPAADVEVSDRQLPTLSTLSVEELR